jgi:HEAT repeat protein
MGSRQVTTAKSQVIEPLIEALGHEDADIREQAVETLGKIRDSRAIAYLVRALEDDDWFVREKAAEALGRIRSRRAVDPLVQVLQDDDWFVREKAAEALGKIGDERAAEPLVKALNDANTNLRRKALDALRAIGRPAVEPLVTALRDGMIVRPGEVIDILGDLPCGRSLRYLVNALEDIDDDIRRAAKRVLRRIGFAPEEVFF